VGFGPVSANGAAFYAGRWVDSATGTIRVLPTANSRYLNPISVNQKLGYLQAKLINHWNNLVSTAEQYYKLSQPEAMGKYAAAKKKGIESSLDPRNIAKKTVTKIDDIIVAIFENRYLKVPDLGMGRYKALILDGYNDEVYAAIYNMTGAQK
jgi:hypothetical protein